MDPITMMEGFGGIMGNKLYRESRTDTWKIVTTVATELAAAVSQSGS